MVKSTDINFTFDSLTERGKFYRKSHSAVFQNGFSVMLVDGTILRDDRQIRRHRSELLFPMGLSKDFLSSFFPDYSIKEEKNRLLLLKGKKIIIKKPSAKGKSSGKSKNNKNKTRNKTKNNIKKHSKERIRFIVLDPGHGGKDPGAVGKDGTHEKWITLRVCLKIRSYLARKKTGIKIKLTRTKDRFIPLGKRTEIANRLLKKNSNGIFVSVHANASISPRVKGHETYFLSQNPSNNSARTTAALENNVILFEKHKKKYNDVDYIEALMLTTQIQKESKSLANIIQDRMKKRNRLFPSRGVKKADFFVLRGALMPAVLVEVGYMTNKKELKYLKQKEHMDRIARSIGEGIIRFVKKYNQGIK